MAEIKNAAQLLRVAILACEEARVLTSSHAETLMDAVGTLEGLARAGQQGTALGAAAASKPIGPTARAVDHPKEGSTTWARHQHYQSGGKPPPRESKADKDAREESERWNLSPRSRGGRPGQGRGRCP